MNIVSLLLVFLMVLLGVAPSGDAPADAAPVLTYGPGHESHQYAAWDNSDGTHSVACDCGIEKRIELHADNDLDGRCDVCGLAAPWEME